VIAGSAYSYDSVARLLSRLALVPDLSDVTLASTGAAGDGSTSQVQFNITATVKGAPAPAAATTTTTAAVAPTTTGVSS
jgi:Tfp pilus assembly protein PilN